MSDQALLRWMETLDRKVTTIAADVAALRESLAVCQSKHRGGNVSPKLPAKLRGSLTKILAYAIVAAVSALATKYGVSP